MSPDGVSRARAWWLTIPALTALAVAVSLAVYARDMAPVQPGDSARFWLAATEVEPPALDPAARESEHFFPSGFEGARIVDGWAYYEAPHLHGSYLYCLPFETALADYDAVLKRLEAERTAGSTRSAVRGYSKWRDDVSVPRRAEGLLQCIDHARREELARTNPAALAYEWLDEDFFQHRWRHAHWYWANLAFEWLYLTGLALFAVWPGIRGGSIYRWAVHWALLPLLFFLPIYLGYGTGYRVGRDGSVLYPSLAHPLSIGTPRPAPDKWLLQHVPRLLEPMSAYSNTTLSQFDSALPGPIVALGMGLAIAAPLLALWAIWISTAKTRRNAKKNGLETQQ